MRRNWLRWLTLTISLSLVGPVMLSLLALTGRLFGPEIEDAEVATFSGILAPFWRWQFLLAMFGLSGLAAALLVAVRE